MRPTIFRQMYAAYTSTGSLVYWLLLRLGLRRVIMTLTWPWTASVSPWGWIGILSSRGSLRVGASACTLTTGGVKLWLCERNCVLPILNFWLCLHVPSIYWGNSRRSLFWRCTVTPEWMLTKRRHHVVHNCAILFIIFIRSLWIYYRHLCSGKELLSFQLQK